MSLIESIKERVSDAMKKNKERAEFKKLVDQQTLPIRRKAYLMEKMKTAFEEGKMIAQQELAKKEAATIQKKPEDFFKVSQFEIPEFDIPEFDIGGLTNKPKTKTKLKEKK